MLGDPDITLITLTELAEQVRRMSRAAALPVLVDADHGYGNALNVRRTVQELETAGAAGLTIEDTLLPQAFARKTQLISLDEGVGKMKAAVDGRGDPALVMLGRTGAVSVTSLGDAIERARAYQETGVERCSSPASRRAPRSMQSRKRPDCRSCSAARRRTCRISIISRNAACGSRCRAMRRSRPPRRRSTKR